MKTIRSGAVACAVLSAIGIVTTSFITFHPEADFGWREIAAFLGAGAAAWSGVAAWAGWRLRSPVAGPLSTWLLRSIVGVEVAYSLLVCVAFIG